MARLAALGTTALVGLLLTGCSAAFGQAGVSIPAAGDDVQTVSDAADSLVANRSSATQNARAAIGVTDALGSIVRDVGNSERILSGAPQAKENAGVRRVLSKSLLVLNPGGGGVSGYCQSSAGYSLKGVPSLDETFGWQSGAYSGGARVSGDNGFSTWSANAVGEAVQAPIGGLSVMRSGSASCPMMAPMFSVYGATATDAFSIPITLTYRHGTLWNLSVSNARFAGGESIDVEMSSGRPPSIAGVITRGRTELATFHTSANGKGTLTITSTGAQYAIADWVVTGTP
ncbi:MAG TPA: hypothetical protein VKR56_10295 [Candidatus Cybelea sp.]|nr:hypothetical protein [Candidatus Cybelea sp.]